MFRCDCQFHVFFRFSCYITGVNLYFIILDDILEKVAMLIIFGVINRGIFRVKFD